MLFLGLLGGMACSGLMAVAQTPDPSDAAALDPVPAAIEAALPETTMLAGGGGPGFWVCRRDTPARFTMLLHLPDTPPHHLWEGLESNGRPKAMAAYGVQSYVVYHDGSAQAVGFLRAADPTQSRFASRQLPPLPQGATLVNLVAGRSGPVVLVRQPSDDPTVTDEGEAAPAPRGSVPVVLRFDLTGWSAIELPEALASVERLQVVMVDASSDDWAVLAWPKEAEQFTVWRYTDGQWTSQLYEGAVSAEAQAVGVQQHIVIVESGDDAHLSAALLRRGKVIPLGKVALAEGMQAWQALGVGNALVVLMSDATGNLSQATRDLSTAADVVTKPEPINVTEMPRHVDESAVAMMIVLVAATVILLATWRRGPAGQRVELPPSVRPAEVWRRVVAALIDLIPGLVIVMFVFSIGDPARVLLENWPGMGPGNWEQMMPALIVIAITIAYSTVSEALTGRTLGKRLTACRVVTSTGQAPNIWQILARNGVKILEMVAYPMLIFMVLSPFRQRLGDVVGKTVVVIDVPIPVEPNDSTPKQD
jgi:uncharacterized RDD family membrane protein YckC